MNTSAPAQVSSGQSDLVNLATPVSEEPPTGSSLEDILGLGQLGGESSTDTGLIPGHYHFKTI